MTAEALLALIAVRMSADAQIDGVDFDGERLVVIDTDGAVHRVEAHGMGFVDQREEDDASYREAVRLKGEGERG